MKKNLRLYEALIKYKELNMSSFHTPGHKNKCKILKKLWDLDFTELDATDSLFESKNVILNAERNASRVFKSLKTLFSAGGCTLCIQAMLRLSSYSGQKIICSRILHKSAINTMAILNLEPVFLKQNRNKITGFFDPVNPSDVRKMLELHSNVGAVYITSPDYFGVISDIKKISEICKIYDVPLIVDNAHGSHLAFLKEDLHPLHLGADMTADSLHKTLPVLTGGALLHINNEKFVKSAKPAMALFGSTSPSYPIMASLDLCSDFIDDNLKQKYEYLIEKLKPIKSIIKEKEFLTPNGSVDPTRISLNLKSVGSTGYECAEFLKKFGVEPELYTEDFLVLISTPFNTDEDFLRLKNAISEFKPLNKKKTSVYDFFEKAINLKMSLNEAILRDFETIDIKKAENKISAGTVCPCPPGIPILMPGEIISKEHIKYLLKCGILFVEVIK